MVGIVTQAPVSIQNILKQEDSLEQNYFSHIKLNTDLQTRADIINDTTGKYSDSDKIRAYTDVYNAYHSLTDNVGVGGDVGVQIQAFDRAVKDSAIGQAITDGNLKQYGYDDGQSNAVGGKEGDAAFFDTLSNLQQQLPQFKRLQSNAAYWAEAADIKLSPDAANLLRAGNESSEDKTFLATYQQQRMALNDAYKAAESTVSLTPQLQQFADIINDQMGKYSDAQKVDALNQVGTSFSQLQAAHPESLSSDPFAIEQSAPLAARVQMDKFMATIANSSVIAAANDYAQKESDFIKKNGGLGDQAQTFKFYDTLTPIEKLLHPELGTPIGTLISQTEERQAALAKETPEQWAQELSAAQLETELLFGVKPTQASGADQSANPRAPFAEPSRLKIQA